MIAGKVFQLLSSSGIEGLNQDSVFAYRVSPSATQEDYQLQVLVSDVLEVPDAQGSDSFRAYEQRVNVKIFFPVDYEGDFHTVQNDIIKFMKDNKYRFHDSSGVLALPDTERLTASLQFWHTEVLDNAL